MTSPLSRSGSLSPTRVTRKALSELLHGHAEVSPEMAIRLGKAFGSTVETWLRMRLAYDLWHAEQRAGDLNVTRFRAPPTLAPC